MMFRFVIAAACALSLAAPAAAEEAPTAQPRVASELPAYLQCAPYARSVSGIQIFGDARTWWAQAQGRYETGSRPREGAVMSFVPHRTMTLGHVATVSKLLDSRTVLLDHANWSPIDGRRGQIERDVLAVDVSPANDWSEVCVRYAPLQGLGTTVWPVAGFIYAKSAKPASVARIAEAPVRAPSERFLSAFANFR